MALFYRKQTIVSPYSADEVIHFIQTTTTPYKNKSDLPKKDPLSPLYKLNGSIKGTSFRVTRRLDTPHFFLTEINGTVEPTETGSVIFIRYGLMWGTIIMLMIGSLVAFIVGLEFFFQREEVLSPLLCMLLICMNVWVAQANFMMQSRQSEKVMLEIISLT